VGECVEGDSHGLINMQSAKYLSASLQNMLKPIQDRLQAVLKNNKDWSEQRDKTVEEGRQDTRDINKGTYREISG
jgi:hypothetical protein